MQKTNLYNAVGTLFIMIIISTFISTSQTMLNLKYSNTPKAVLIPTEKFYFNSFVDCNMAEAWIGDTFRIFPGKYGEDLLWGYAHDLKFADGRNADEAFSSKAEAFTEPIMPKNAKPGTEGLHGAVWFETVYQDTFTSIQKIKQVKHYLLYIIMKITRPHYLMIPQQVKVI